jgi:hypothetical protein
MENDMQSKSRGRIQVVPTNVFQISHQIQLIDGLISLAALSKPWPVEHKGSSVPLVAQAFQPAVSQVWNLQIVRKPSALGYSERARGADGQPARKPAIRQAGKPALQVKRLPQCYCTPLQPKSLSHKGFHRPVRRGEGFLLR